jgi:ABC-2 type transport system permease protein
MIAAELYKAHKTRSVWWLSVVGALSCVVWAVVDVLVWHDTAPAAYSMAQQGYLFAMIIGVLLVAGEYRHQTITWALLVTPRRSQVVVAKLVACGVVGLAVGLAAAVVTTVATAVVLSTQGSPVFTGGVPGVLLGSVASTMLWTVFGGALAALVRNQVAAVVVAFVWFFYAEWFLVMLVPAVGRWTPTGAAKAVSGWTRDAMPVAGDLLPVWLGGLVFLAYAAVAATLAMMTTTRRDVT